MLRRGGLTSRGLRLFYIRHRRCLLALAVIAALGLPLGWHLSSFEVRIRHYVDRIDGILAGIDVGALAGGPMVDLPVYYVNMDAHTDRRQRIETRLTALRPPPPLVVRVAGVDGLARMSTGGSGVHSGFEWESAGELGCTLSHLAAAKQIYLAGHEAAIVLEDDAHLGLAGLWPRPVSWLTRQLPTNWTTIQLYHGTQPFEEPPDLGPERLRLVPYDLSAQVRSPGTVAYAISRRGAELLLSLTDGGTAVHRRLLHTRDGRADTVMYEFPESAPYVVWPRYVFPYNDMAGAPSTIHATGTRHHLWHVRVAASIVDRAAAVWAASGRARTSQSDGGGGAGR